jgi:hypothetical protein
MRQITAEIHLMDEEDRREMVMRRVIASIGEEREIINSLINAVYPNCKASYLLPDSREINQLDIQD